jgi:hypothetical protein
MPQDRQYAFAGEESNPNPFGRGCLPLTIMIGITMAMGGGIGWALGDWLGMGLGMAAVLAGWVHFIWS